MLAGGSPGPGGGGAEDMSLQTRGLHGQMVLSRSEQVGHACRCRAAVQVPGHMALLNTYEGAPGRSTEEWR